MRKLLDCSINIAVSSSCDSRTVTHMRSMSELTMPDGVSGTRIIAAQTCPSCQWRPTEQAMSGIVISANLGTRPVLKVRQRQRRGLTAVIVVLLKDRGLLSALQQMYRAHSRPDQTFNMTTIMRRAGRKVLNGNPHSWRASLNAAL